MNHSLIILTCCCFFFACLGFKLVFGNDYKPDSNVIFKNKCTNPTLEKKGEFSYNVEYSYNVFSVRGY